MLKEIEAGARLGAVLRRPDDRDDPIDRRVHQAIAIHRQRAAVGQMQSRPFLEQLLEFLLSRLMHSLSEEVMDLRPFLV